MSSQRHADRAGAPRLARCVDCDRQRHPQRRVEGGVICGDCDRRRGNTDGVCVACGDTAPLMRALCVACRLRERVSQLAGAADPNAGATLAPYLAALADAPNAASTLRWLQSPTLRLLEDLLAGRLAITHAALDGRQGDEGAGRGVGFVRAALVHHGVLQWRDEQSATFARWQQRAIDVLPAGPDRGHVRGYANWHVAHGLAYRNASGRGSAAPLKHARQLVSEAIKLVTWLHEQQLTLRDLRQDLVEHWVSDGASTRRLVRMFLAWLQRAGVTGELHVAWIAHGPGVAPMSEEERFAALRLLLHKHTIDPPVRFAGLLLLLYAQPLTRTAALHSADVAAGADGQITVTLARGAIPLPEPLGSLAHALRYARRASSDGGEGWLLPGQKAGTHITAEQLRERLKNYGIASRPSRHAALLVLAAKLPAPILAERLGFHQARAAQWVRAAGSTYADYVALRAGAS